ncbi:MAG: hypothetical protein ACOCVV_03550 [Marinobacter sp.]
MTNPAEQAYLKALDLEAAGCKGLGMPNFSGDITERELEQITASIQGTADGAQKAAKEQQAEKPAGSD